MHVRLNSSKFIREAGKYRRYEAGDWVNVGRQLALAWIAAGEAGIPGLEKAEAIAGDLGDSGIVALGNVQPARLMRKRYPLLSIKSASAPCVPFQRTLIWWPKKVTLAPEQAIVGFSRVEKSRPEYAAWEVAAMLFGPNAAGFGSAEEKAKTKKVVGDLRVPIFNVHALWIRKTSRAERLMTEWWQEVEGGADRYHAFLRALKRNPLPICTLPVGWVGIR